MVPLAVGVGLIQPFMVTRKILFTIFSSPRLVMRMIAAGWVVEVRRGGPGREALFDFQSAQDAYARLKRGEEPPLLPCEIRRRKV